jgi:carbamoyltransferase
MWILAFNITHDASVTLLKNGEIVFHQQEERLTHVKHDSAPLYSLQLVKKYTDVVDYCAYSFLENNDEGALGTYFKYIEQVLGIEVKKYVSLSEEHHLLHALCGFVHSGFDDAAIMVMDGGGADFDEGQEVESIYTISKPNKINIVEKNYYGKGFLGAGQVYAAVTSYLGWHSLDNGKTMGLFPYGKENPSIKRMITSRGGVTPLFKQDDEYKEETCLTLREYPQLKRSSKEDIAYKLQKDFEEYIFQFATKTLELTGKKKLIWTGGCALNCSANFKLRKMLPDDVSLYVEPISSDVGISLGAAYFCQILSGGLEKSERLPQLYLGRKIEYDYDLLSGEEEIEVTPDDVAKLISEQNIVAICQGRSESGPRALGNRSILFDPRNPDGKDIVNRVKRRESFRPFAGTVLLDHVKDWFDLACLEESPNMMYTVDVLNPEKIPAITHVDNSCRVQTLRREQNKNYYDLISSFYKLTGVPILFNTSFNLAGDTIVETMEDALKTLRKSEIEYLFLPELNKLIYVPNH